MAPVLARFVAPLDGVARVEALRCQRMGAFKWKDPGLGYRLADTPRPGGALVDRVCHQFAARRRRVYPAPAHPETVIRCAQRPSNGGAGGVFGC